MPSPTRPAGRIVRSALLTCLLFGHGIGHAQADTPKIDPAVEALIRQSTAAYSKLTSYQHIETHAWSFKGAQGEQKVTLEYTLAMQRPNLFLFKANSRGADVIACDGAWLTRCRPVLQDGAILRYEYTRVPAPATLSGIPLVNGQAYNVQLSYLVSLMCQGDALADPRERSLLAHGKLGAEAVVDGKPAQTLVITDRDTTITLYFDRDAHTLIKVDQLNPYHLNDVITETLQEVRTDFPPDSTLFHYALPEGAVPLKRFADPEEEQSKKLIARYEGKPAANFALKDRAGKTVSLSSLKGKVVILDFWASWCGPCKRVMPILEEIHARLAKQGVVVLAIDTWDEPSSCSAFLKSHPQLTMRVLMDPARLDAERSVARRLYGAYGIPTTVIIDRQGVIRTYANAAHDRAFYMNALKDLGIRVAGK